MLHSFPAINVKMTCTRIILQKYPQRPSCLLIRLRCISALKIWSNLIWFCLVSIYVFRVSFVLVLSDTCSHVHIWYIRVHGKYDPYWFVYNVMLKIELAIMLYERTIKMMIASWMLLSMYISLTNFEGWGNLLADYIYIINVWVWWEADKVVCV